MLAAYKESAWATYSSPITCIYHLDGQLGLSFCPSGCHQGIFAYQCVAGQRLSTALLWHFILPARSRQGAALKAEQGSGHFFAKNE